MKDNTVSPYTVCQLLSLIRSSLWQTPIELCHFSYNSANWDEIGRIAMQQTVGILMAEAALSLPENLLPPKDWIRKAYAIMERNRRTHRLLDGCVAESVTRLKDAGIDTVLLKGQAYARKYPYSALRQCGDIDLYVGVENYRRAYNAVKQFGWEKDESLIPDAKHYGCRLRGVRIELHRIAGQLFPRSVDRNFQEWSRTELLTSGEGVVIDGVPITVPSPIFSIVFVFMHLYHHFLNGGIGLRHVCDWTMLLHAYSKCFDRVELENRLREFHLLRAWKYFAPIAVRHLGLPAPECPFYSPDYDVKSEKILSFILREGNFGRAVRTESKRPDGYFAGKLHSFVNHSVRIYSKLWIDPIANTYNYYSYVKIGIKQVVRDIIKKIR
ncbi:MAG: nucleotidyltransferase family protein [Muribaculaceae bacterium]|nr:nucleotidyltransferase family protein [Muribaculaceae bacterium]